MVDVDCSPVFPSAGSSTLENAGYSLRFQHPRNAARRLHKGQKHPGAFHRGYLQGLERSREQSAVFGGYGTARTPKIRITTVLAKIYILENVYISGSINKILD
ncbi:hypothetical protein OOU_Y34scaffold00587g7 [Pyricularia oryzae Y34]|uniref:Uncharacterized protein n=2 Tax=Pyricularia oryzae TaxID=318829 RepID=A0AA97NWL6_PYRO3|nr:hypothetical protein OOU_Y34scaffold00587g7 [Pyricularia oryzae Y34]